MKIFPVISFIMISTVIYSQTDMTTYPWPTPPFNSSRGLTGTFGEFRNTGSSDHFHNAVDIGEPDGNPVYPCISGEVYYLSDNGYDSYISVRSIIEGQKKHITYYHVVPSPSLSIGQQVIVGQSIIGTIYNGAAHVHLIERELLQISESGIGNAINPVRPEGGLRPYFDNYAPEITSSSLGFFKDNSSVQVPSDQLTGKVDIRIEVREKNGPSYSHSNNGTYILGYRVLSENGNMTIYEPNDNGTKYRFYYIPSNGYVHNVFVKNVATLSDPIYWLTNGYGESHINSTLTVANNYLDTDLLDEGSYLLEVFSEDTRDNKTSMRFPFSVVKLPPDLRTVLVKNDSIKISWSEYKLNNLKGYRIYYTGDRSLNNWELAADETVLRTDISSVSFNGPDQFMTPSTDDELYFYITAVDEKGIESMSSDIYSLSIKDSKSPSAIIVDGFDLYGGKGSWEHSQHYFNKLYFDAIIDNASYNISSCSNEAIIEDEVDLKEYDMVVWFVGDESIADNTFVNPEQYRIALYLQGGGRVLISGEDIGLDLDTRHSSSEYSDTLFYHQYLKANLIHDGLDLLYEVYGEESSQFNNIHVTFGEVYPVERPDDIEPINGAHSILNYTYERDGNYRKGGIAYQGTFGNSNEIGTIVYLSFPFETISSDKDRKDLFYGIQNYFENGPVKVGYDKNQKLDYFYLSQNYPNPFNPITTIRFTVPTILQSEISTDVSQFNVRIIVYDVLGREITTLVNGLHKPGTYQVEFNAYSNSNNGGSLSSGIYYYRFISKEYSQTKKMIFLK